MLLDARRIERGAVVEADLCIVGAGAAGIALARELAGTPLSVCLLESGGFQPDAATQSLYEGPSRGTLLEEGGDYLSRSRLRFFGGSTNHWQGWCRPLDPLDFEARPWVEHSGWPLDRGALEPYYARAAELVQIPHVGDAEAPVLAGPGALLLPGSEWVATRLFTFSPPTAFGRVYRDALARAPNVTLLTHANVREIRLDAGGSRVESVRVACLEDNAFDVRARYTALAAGGIENARLLLASNRQRPAGIGNGHDRVGRYFADHPVLDVGHVVLTDAAPPTGFYRFHVPADPRFATHVLGVLSLSERALRERHLLNLRVYLRPERTGPRLAAEVGEAASGLAPRGPAAGGP